MLINDRDVVKALEKRTKMVGKSCKSPKRIRAPWTNNTK